MNNIEEINKNNDFDTAVSTENSVSNFFEKVIPVMSAVDKNSYYLASKSALEYVKSDKQEDKEKAKKWLERHERFKNSLNWLMSDELVSEEFKNKYKVQD